MFIVRGGYKGREQFDYVSEHEQFGEALEYAACEFGLSSRQTQELASLHTLWLEPNIHSANYVAIVTAQPIGCVHMPTFNVREI